MIGLLKLIRASAHGKRERKQSTMAKVESDLQMFAVLQEKQQSLNKYYKLFTAQTEVIKANGGRAGYNPELYHEHLLKVITAKGYTRTEYRGKTDTERAEIREEATKDACSEFLACLFLRNADQARYVGIWKRLACNYVLSAADEEKRGKVYPKTLIKMKRVMFEYEEEDSK